MQSSALKNLSIITFFTFMLSVSASFGAPPATPAAGPKIEPVKCATPPDTQVVNNAGVKIHQVKVGNVLFHENLSACSDGCSTGFKTVNKGQNQVAVKMNSTSAWVNLGSLGQFEECTHYAVNLSKKDKKLCAELFTRKNTDPTFNNDPTKQKTGAICRPFTLITGPEKPAVSTGMTPSAQVNAGSSGQPPANAVNMNPGQIQLKILKPKLENAYFTGKVRGALVMDVHVAGLSDAGTESIPTIYAQFNEVIDFNCGVIAENVQDLQARIYIDGGGAMNTGRPTITDLPDGKKEYAFRCQSVAYADTILTVRFTGIAPGGIARVEKQIRIISKSPAFEVKRPGWNNDTREMTFRVKNTGDISFPSKLITVIYHIKGLPGNETIVSSTLSPTVAVDRGHTVSLGTITLPESVLAYDRFEVSVKIESWFNGNRLPSAEADYTYTWETRTFTINESLLSMFSGLFSGHVRVNTFEKGHGERSDSQPYAENDSHLALTVNDPGGASRPVFDQAIPISWFRFGSDGVEAYVYIKNLEARIDGTNLFFIRDGKLGLRITFNCSANREIEVWARDAIAKCWRDNWLPDLDLRNFVIELMLTPVLSDQKISYSDLTMKAKVDLEIPGHYIERWLERKAASEIEKSFASVFDNADVKTAIENNFNQLVSGNPLVNIRRLVGVRGTGKTIVITYR